MIRILRAADRVAVPWKNGGGITREVAVWPPDAGLDDFEWRVSIAEVREPGPFSIFRGIDRTLMVLQGQLELRFADRTMELSPASEPFAFAGDVACDGRPIGGPVMDLNVMTRRGICTAQVQRLKDAPMGMATLVVATTLANLRYGKEEASLEPLDAGYVEDASPPSTLSGSAVVITINR